MTNEEFDALKSSVIDATILFIRDCADVANKEVSADIEMTANNHLRDFVLTSWSVNNSENIATLQDFKIKFEAASEKIKNGDFLGIMSVPGEFADTIDDALFQTYRNSNNMTFDQTADVLNTAYNAYDFSESLPLDPTKFSKDGALVYVDDVLSATGVSKLSFWAGGLAGIAEAGVAGYEAGTDAAIAKALETVAAEISFSLVGHSMEFLKNLFPGRKDKI